MNQLKNEHGSMPMLNHFRLDRRGSISIVFGFALLILCGCIGAAIDYGRWVSARQQTQGAVDAALLAASRVAQLTGNRSQAIAAANDHYDKMKSNNLLDDGIAFNSGSTLNDWKVSGGARVPTPFLNLIGVSHLPVMPRASASVALGGTDDSNLEISLMLDLTGSMCPTGSEPCSTGPKIDALKKAATDLINLVVWDNQTSTTSRVALVPFASQIRVGADDSNEGAQLMKKLTNLNRYYTGKTWDCSPWVVTAGGPYVPPSGGTSEGGGTPGSGGDIRTCPEANYIYPPVNLKIAPCVTDRFTQSQVDNWINDGTSDLQWSLNDNKPGSHAWLNAADGTRMPLSETSSDINPTFGTGTGIVNNNSATPSARKNDAWQNWNYNEDGNCWGSPVNNIIMPLTADKTALLNRIAGFQAYGSTGGAMATQWAWYMLSPNWDNIWTGDSKPGAYSALTETTATGAPKLKKIAVLLTDGVYNTYRNWNGQAVGPMSNYAQKVCREMKAAGITVYTVGFGLNELSPSDQAVATTTLMECSTNHTIADGTRVFNFYDVRTGTPDETAYGLRGAFRDIGLQLTKLRLTE
jgi:Putative Flp pilus-assembly TadE/G-like